MADWFKLIKRNLAEEKLFAVATRIAGDGKPGRKLIIYPDGSTDGDLQPPKIRLQVIEQARRLMQQETSTTLTIDGGQVFVEVFSPPPRLIIIGAVHTAIPLSRLAKTLGFRVIVVDGRSRFATPERFPGVDEIIQEWPDEAIPKLSIGSSTYVVILTHDPKFDLPALKALARFEPRYIGAMGSRETRRKHMDQLRAEGLPEEFLNQVYGPVGLDLGARTAEEMALSIMAEIIAVRYGRTGGHLNQQGSNEDRH